MKLLAENNAGARQQWFARYKMNSHAVAPAPI